MDLTPSEQLAHGPVRIESEDASGDIATGTAFFFVCLDDGRHHAPVLVTNRHVVAGGQRGRFYLTRRDGAGDPVAGSHVQVVLDDFEKRWLPHPNRNVDLAVMPVAPLLEEARAGGSEFFYIALPPSLIPTAEELADIGALEDIVMVGYPNGIWDSANNMPLFRRGITATNPSVDYEGRPEFMIDAACFPGSSGSPVFLYNVGGWTDRKGNVMMGGTRIRLLGVLYAGPQHTATGEVQVVTVPTQQRAIAMSAIPNNLGLVVKSSQLAAFDDVLRPLAGA